jgi:putative endonuclease
MKTDRQKLGSAGEDMAAAFLQKNGYRIVDRNFQAGKFEIDLICLDGNDLVIVEVKSVRGPGYGRPEARISRFKQRSIIKATYLFLNKNPKFKGKNVRFDVVCINLKVYPADINHYKSAFWEQRF